MEKKHEVLKGYMEAVATEIKLNDRTTMKNTTKKLASTSGALKIPVVKKTQILTTKPKSVVYFRFNQQLGHRVAAGYTEPSMTIHEVGRFCIVVCRCLLCLNSRTTDG